MKSILFVAGEGLPFIKSGGLADVIGALPKNLVKQGQDVRVVLPLYKSIAEKHRDTFENLGTFNVSFGYFQSVATVFTKEADGVKYYFIQHAPYFERDGLYGYPDDGERFAFFQVAVLEMLQHLNYFPDIIHEHDWHTGMVPVLCKERYYTDERYARIKHVFTIHNMAFQGIFPSVVLESLFGLSQELFNNGKLRFRDSISFMKGAIVYADKVTTVSETYAKEILTPYFGENMENVLELRRGDLSGIVNGIDTEAWDPKTDKYLPFPLLNTQASKNKHKLALQERLGLRQSKETMLVGIVTRLTWQKGLPLLIDKLTDVLSQDVQLVILGSGDTNYENILKGYEYRYKRRVCFYCGYNEELAHQIYAGCDLFLMPSLFEPCGISQLNAMHYGCVPLVRETGGLKDTVMPYNEFTKEGWGFSFTSYSGDDFLFTFRRAVDFYYDRPEDYQNMVKACREVDVSWDNSASKYIALYESMFQ